MRVLIAYHIKIKYTTISKKYYNMDCFKRITSVMVLLLGLLCMPGSTGVIAQNSNACPSGDPTSLDRVQSFLEDSAWADERRELGISVGASQARVLSDTEDLSACQTLIEMFPDPDEKDRAYYKAGPYYFVMYRWSVTSNNEVNLGSPGFIVLNSDFDVLRFYV